MTKGKKVMLGNVCIYYL